jgi:hypothetical protein
LTARGFGLSRTTHQKPRRLFFDRPLPPLIHYQWVSTAFFTKNDRPLRRRRTAPFEEGGCKSLILNKGWKGAAKSCVRGLCGIKTIEAPLRRTKDQAITANLSTLGRSQRRPLTERTRLSHISTSHRVGYHTRPQRNKERPNRRSQPTITETICDAFTSPPDFKH